MDTTDDFPADAFATIRALLVLITDPGAAAAKLEQIEGRLKACATAETKIAADRAKFDDHVQAERAKLAVTSDEVSKRLLAARQAEGAISLREQRIQALEEAWAFVGENDDVKRGFKDPERSSLQKARGVYGLDPAPEAEPEPLDLLERAEPDPHFLAMPGSTITKSVPRSAHDRRPHRRAVETSRQS